MITAKLEKMITCKSLAVIDTDWFPGKKSHRHKC